MPAKIRFPEGVHSPCECVVAAENPANSSLSNRLSLHVNLEFSSNKESQVPQVPHSGIWDFIDRFSSASKLICITAYCLRFLLKVTRRTQAKTSNSKQSLAFTRLEFLEFSENSSSRQITPQELENSRLLWVYLVQRNVFSEEVKQLVAQSPLKSKSTLLRLSPFLERDLLRGGGRLRHSLLDDTSKHPLILRSKIHFLNY